MKVQQPFGCLRAPSAARRIAPIVIAIGLVGSRPAAASAQGETLALTGVTVIDGTGAQPMPDMTVLIEGERIAGLFQSGEQRIPAGAIIRDLSGHFVIPGLIEGHGHFGTEAPEGALDDSGVRADPDAPVRRLLQRLLRAGVTTVRQMGGDCRVLGLLAREAESRSSRGPSPDIEFAAVVVGPASLSDPRRSRAPTGAAAGDSGRGRGAAGGSPPGCVQLVADQIDPVRIVDAAKAAGADAVKLYADIPADAVAAITDEAHRQGMRVWAHATLFPARPGELVRAGVDVLSHAMYLIWEAVDSLPDYHSRVRLAPFERIAPSDPAIVRLLESMARRGTILDATLLIVRATADAPDSVVDYRADREKYQAAARWSASVTALARELGVLVAAGTDLIGAGDDNEPPGIHREMELLVREAGFTPTEAIAAATGVAARAAGVEDSRGTLAAGKLADLVVLRADPTADIRNTREIEFVVKRGRIVE